MSLPLCLQALCMPGVHVMVLSTPVHHVKVWCCPLTRISPHGWQGDNNKQKGGVNLPFEIPQGKDSQKSPAKVKADFQQNLDKSKERREAKTEQSKKDREQRQKQRERDKDGDTCYSSAPGFLEAFTKRSALLLCYMAVNASVQVTSDAVRASAHTSPVLLPQLLNQTSNACHTHLLVNRHLHCIDIAVSVA